MAAPTDHPHSPLRLRCIDELRLDPGDTVLDAGCGTGLAFEPLFERIGRRGRLIAFEQDPALHAQAEMRAQGLRAQGWQVEVLCARAQEVLLPARPDAALFHDVHDIIGTPAAVAHLFAQFPAGMRIAVAGGRPFPWWRLLPTLLTRWLARRRAPRHAPPQRPWALVEPHLQSFKCKPTQGGRFYIGSGRVKGAGP